MSDGDKQWKRFDIELSDVNMEKPTRAEQVRESLIFSIFFGVTLSVFLNIILLYIYNHITPDAASGIARIGKFLFGGGIFERYWQTGTPIVLTIFTYPLICFLNDSPRYNVISSIALGVVLSLATVSIMYWVMSPEGILLKDYLIQILFASVTVITYNQFRHYL